MRERLRQLSPSGRALVILALATAGFGSWWWLSAQREAVTVVEAPRHPDSYFRDLDVVRHDASGHAEMHVEAAYAEHFENEPWIHLRDLDARGLDAGPDWRLSANEGRMTDDGVELDAWGDVVLTRANEDGGAMKLRTEKLSVNTDTQIAMTDEIVLITQGASEISGRGLRVSLADDYLRIASDVEARYEK